MKLKGKIVGYKEKGDSGFPEITIGIPKMNDTTTIPLLKEVEIKWMKKNYYLIL